MAITIYKFYNMLSFFISIHTSTQHFCPCCGCWVLDWMLMRPIDAQCRSIPISKQDRRYSYQPVSGYNIQPAPESTSGTDTAYNVSMFVGCFFHFNFTLNVMLPLSFIFIVLHPYWVPFTDASTLHRDRRHNRGDIQHK